MSAVEQIVARIEDRLDHIERRLENGGGRVVYDAAALRRMGIPKHRAYAILREHGSARGPNGRLIITRAVLERALERPVQ